MECPYIVDREVLDLSIKIDQFVDGFEVFLESVLNFGKISHSRHSFAVQLEFTSRPHAELRQYRG